MIPLVGAPDFKQVEPALAEQFIEPRTLLLIDGPKQNRHWAWPEWRPATSKRPVDRLAHRAV